MRWRLPRINRHVGPSSIVSPDLNKHSVGATLGVPIAITIQEIP